MAATTTLSQFSSPVTPGLADEFLWRHSLEAAACASHHVLHSKARFCPTASVKTIESRAARNTRCS